MADSQSLKSPKDEEREAEGSEQSGEEDKEVKEEEKPLCKVQKSHPSIAIPDYCSAEAVLRGQSFQLETLDVPSPLTPPESDRNSDCRSFSQLLAGAMASPAAILSDGLDVKPTISSVTVDPSGFSMVCSPASLKSAGIKIGQFAMSHQEVLASVTAQAHAQKQLQTGYLTSPELSPTSHTTSMSSPLSPIPLQRRLPPIPQDKNFCTPVADQQNSSDQKTKPNQVIVKTPSSDGYNWRKYGQKQVKSAESSRSYYKCTYSDCHAKKKVERCDHSCRVIEIIYKGQHNHDPPRKIRCTKARRIVSSAGSVEGSEVVNHSVKKHEDSDPPTSIRELQQATLPITEKKRQSSSASDRDAEIKTEEEHYDEPDQKRMIKENTVAYSVPLYKTVKEPKIVVQASGDVGISSDGYRWRKYGQKMVKGNPNPRSYYKCTSSGCPVRKHVERSTDDTTAIIITYEGKHDHDMPVPKKRHGPPSAALLIAAAAAMNNAQLKKSEALINQKASAQWAMDMEGEFAGGKAMELGGEKALESARTLLSIGIELKPC